MRDVARRESLDQRFVSASRKFHFIFLVYLRALAHTSDTQDTHARYSRARGHTGRTQFTRGSRTRRHTEYTRAQTGRYFRALDRSFAYSKSTKGSHPLNEPESSGWKLISG